MKKNVDNLILARLVLIVLDLHHILNQRIIELLRLEKIIKSNHSLTILP